MLKYITPSRLNKHAALKLLRKLRKEYRSASDKIVPDDLRSYGATARELEISDRHERGRWRHKWVENFHKPT
jgi:putative transposase